MTLRLQYLSGQRCTMQTRLSDGSTLLHMQSPPLPLSSSSCCLLSVSIANCASIRHRVRVTRLCLQRCISGTNRGFRTHYFERRGRACACKRVDASQQVVMVLQVKEADHLGCTALHRAYEFGHSEAVELLLQVMSKPVRRPLHPADVSLERGGCGCSEQGSCCGSPFQSCYS